MEGGVGGAMGMEGAAGAALLPNPSHGPTLPLPQPPVGPQFPPYRGLMPPFVSTLYHLGGEKQWCCVRI